MIRRRDTKRKSRERGGRRARKGRGIKELLHEASLPAACPHHQADRYEKMKGGE